MTESRAFKTNIKIYRTAAPIRKHVDLCVGVFVGVFIGVFIGVFVTAWVV